MADEQDEESPAQTKGPGPADPPRPTRLQQLKANAAWVTIRKALLLHAYKINNKSVKGADDLVQTAIAAFAEKHGSDVDALGGPTAIVNLIKPLVANARDRSRQSYETRKGSFSLSPRILSKLSEANDPETALTQNHERTSWDTYLARVEELSAPYPCAKLLMEAVNRSDEDTAASARAAGFTNDQINNERKRLKRLRSQAARELGLLPEGETDGNPEDGQ